MSADAQHEIQTACDSRGAAVSAATVTTVRRFPRMKATGPRVEVQVTLEDFLFLLQLIKGKKKQPLQHLKTSEYTLQFPGLYATSCKCYYFQPLENRAVLQMTTVGFLLSWSKYGFYAFPPIKVL